MLGRSLRFFWLQNPAAVEPWTQKCCSLGVACSSTAASTAVAESVVQQANTGAADTSKAANSSRGTQPKAKADPAQHHKHLTFDQLHDNINQLFALQNVQAEAKIRVLIQKANTSEQVTAALATLRHNYMKRCKIKQTWSYAPDVLHDLLKAGTRAGLGANFAVQLLEQANSLGVRTSIGTCEEVIKACLKDHNYLAAQRAWLYTRAYCSMSGQQLGSAWASKNLIRLYLKSMTEWLQQGGLGKNHQQRLRREVAELSQELKSRGANASWAEDVLQQAKSGAGSGKGTDEQGAEEQRKAAAENGSGAA